MTDRFTVRAVVVGLIFITLCVVGALVYALAIVDLAAEQRGTVIGALVAIGTGSFGALAGILAHTATNDPGTATTTTTGPIVPIEPLAPPVAGDASLTTP